jgi:hypothetical protein
MNWSDVGKSIAKMAPLLGTALAGPGGAAIGSIVAATFGGDKDNPEDIYNKIVADPDASVKLAEIQTNCRVELQRMAVQAAAAKQLHEQTLYKTEVEDRQSAREYDKELARIGKTNFIPAFIVVVLYLGMFVFIYMLFTSDIDADVKTSIDMITGALIAELIRINSFHFGSTSSSRIKDFFLGKRN